MTGHTDLLGGAQDSSRLARIAVRLTQMYTVGVEALGQADTVIDDKCHIVVSTDSLQGIRKSRRFVMIDILHAQLEGRNGAARQSSLQSVRKDPAHILWADQVKLARVGPRWRRKDGQIGFVFVHVGCISEGGGFVQ